MHRYHTQPRLATVQSTGSVGVVPSTQRHAPEGAEPVGVDDGVGVGVVGDAAASDAVDRDNGPPFQLGVCHIPGHT